MGKSQNQFTNKKHFCQNNITEMQFLKQQCKMSN